MAARWVRLAAATAATVALTVAAPPRVALYVGKGSSSGSGGNFSAAFTKFAAAGTIASVARLTEKEVTAAELTTANYDVVVFPGGGGSAEASAIGTKGAAAVKAFVSAGGGYYGTCAGGFLASSKTCCSEVIPGYCKGAVGCSPSSYGLALIDLAAAEPWDRGHGYVTMMFNDAAVAQFQLDPAVYSAKNISLLYFQGPIAAKNYAENYTVHARFTTEIHSGHTNYTTGQMIG